MEAVISTGEAFLHCEFQLGVTAGCGIEDTCSTESQWFTGDGLDRITGADLIAFMENMRQSVVIFFFHGNITSLHENI